MSASRPSRLRPPRALALAAVLLALVASALSCAKREEPRPMATGDPRAIEVARGVLTALGGQDRWDALPGLRWSFVVMVGDTMRSDRRHAWDKRTGWHRVDYRSADSTRYVLVHKVGTTEGRAWVNGAAIEGDSLVKLMARAERLWTNDTYWMLMPYKMLDPGVKLAYDSEKQLEGATYDVISMTFEGVGQTPGDHYWVYVNRTNRRVERWDMVLEGDQPPPESYTWDDWVESGGLWFPTTHRQGDRAVMTKDVEAVTRFGDTEFTAI